MVVKGHLAILEILSQFGKTSTAGSSNKKECHEKDGTIEELSAALRVANITGSQLNTLAIEKDVYNLQKECREKDGLRGADITGSRALRKEPLTVYGDGKQTRSFQYVSNLVEGLMRLMKGEHVGPFNLGNPGEFTMLELAQVVQETLDPNTKIEFRQNTEDDPHKRKPNITKAKDLLGWTPNVPLRKGLPLTVADFQQRIFGDHQQAGSTS